MNQEDKSIEHLLKPRYKLVVRYPHYPFDGDQLLVDENGELFHEIEGYPQSIYKMMEEEAKSSPCFRLMEWWQDRRPEEMPQYVKYAGDGVVRKVSKWDLESTSAWFMFLDSEIQPYSPGGSALENTHWLPATETDFLTYINKKP